MSMSRYLKALQEAGLIDPAGMRALLRDRFDPAWLEQYRLVIIDGLVPDRPHRSGHPEKDRNLRRCLFLVHAPSRESLDRAAEMHPLRIVTGLCLVAGTRPRRSKRPASLRQDSYLAAALFSGEFFYRNRREGALPLPVLEKDRPAFRGQHPGRSVTASREE